MYCSHGLPYETKCSKCTAEAFVRERERAEQSRTLSLSDYCDQSLRVDGNVSVARSVPM